MEIPVNFLMWITAALPIIILLVLMVKFQWGAVQAIPVGLFAAIIVSLTLYKADIPLIAMGCAKGIWSALSILIVVWPAILAYEIANEAQAFTVFQVGLRRFAPNELLQILIFSWVFGSFLQGITGFGVPVAVGAPLLVGIGMSPMWAVIISLIASAWGQTFGTLAMAWDALALQANLGEDPALLLRTALYATFFIWLWNFITGVMICWFYAGMNGLKKGLPAVLVISLIHGGGQVLLGQVNQTLACFVPACVALAASLLLGRSSWYNTPWQAENSSIMDRSPKGSAGAEDYPRDMNLHQAFLPYYALTIITLVVLLVPPVKDLLGQVKLGFAFPEMSTGYNYVNPAVAQYSPLAIFTHASMFLSISALIGFVYYRRHGWIARGQGKAVLQRTVKKTIPSSLAVLGFLLMSRIMSSTGQTVVLAQGVSAVLGQGYALLAPLVGMMGSFMTSSNMASNILFGEFQLTTANLLGLDAAAILGAQTAGGSIGICPGNVILGTTTAGILGREGEVLKKVLPLSIATSILVGVILFALLVIL